jgi:hypothetical protein
MSIRKIAAAALLLGTVFASSPSYVTPAQATVIGQETDLLGFVGPLLGPTDTHLYFVASDGEALFRPIDILIDVSDAIVLDPTLPWVQAADSHWTSLGAGVWVLSAADLLAAGCGTENEPTCEPVGHWILPIASSWNTFVGSWEILSSDGVTISDVITTFDVNGQAELTFSSDPFVAAPAPEPMTLALFGAGLAGLGAMRRRKAKA